MVAHSKLANVDYRAGILLGIGGVIGAQVGARLVEHVSTANFKKIFAFVLVGLARVYFFSRNSAMAEKEIYISGVGKTVLVHSKRAKHINLSIKPFLGIRIAVPLRVSMRQAEMVAHAKAPWLRRHQAQMAEIETAGH